MKRVLKTLLYLLIVGFIVIQFFRPEKITETHPPELAVNQVFTVSDKVMNSFKAACYDCHSDEVRYPWYWNVQPTRWLLYNHIKDGKKHLNFSAIGSYSLARQFKKLGEIKEEMEDGEMPQKGYTFIHADARLTQDQKNEIYDWVKEAQASMQAKYPADSLILKKK